MLSLAKVGIYSRLEDISAGRSMDNGADLLTWPNEGVSRVPYAVFSDAAVYRREQERIFRGPTWHFLALEAELPEAGAFKTTQVGDTPIIVVRDGDGAINA